MTKFSYTSFINWRTASSVCGEVGLAATELDEALDELAAPENDEPRSDEPPVDADGSCGGWCRRRKRAPEGVRKAETYAAAGG